MRSSIMPNTAPKIVAVLVCEQAIELTVERRRWHVFRKDEKKATFRNGDADAWILNSGMTSAVKTLKLEIEPGNI
jgi:hypothetical protein